MKKLLPQEARYIQLNEATKLENIKDEVAVSYLEFELPQLKEAKRKKGVLSTKKRNLSKVCETALDHLALGVVSGEVKNLQQEIKENHDTYLTTEFKDEAYTLYQAHVNDVVSLLENIDNE